MKTVLDFARARQQDGAHPIVRFRGDRIHSEHIYWDQASVLVQVGLLDPRLYPTAGIETARKAFDESEPSNTIMARWKESEGK